MSKSAGTTSTVSSSAPPSFQQPYIDQLLSEAKNNYATGGPNFYPGSTVAEFPFNELAGQEQVINASDALHQQYQNTIPGAVNMGLTSYDVANNPYIKAASEAAIRPVFQSLTEEALPQIRNEAAGIGQYGSSKMGIGEGLATSRATQQGFDITSKMYGDAYSQGLNLLGQTLGQTPTIAAGVAAPGLNTAAVGAQQRGLEQAKIDENVARYQHEQNQPFANLSEYANLISGPFGGSGTSTVSAEGGDNASQIAGLSMELLPYLYSLFGYFF